MRYGSIYSNSLSCRTPKAIGALKTALLDAHSSRKSSKESLACMYPNYMCAPLCILDATSSMQYKLNDVAGIENMISLHNTHKALFLQKNVFGWRTCFIHSSKLLDSRHIWLFKELQA